MKNVFSKLLVTIVALTVVITVINVTQKVTQASYKDTVYTYQHDSDTIEITDLYTGGRLKEDYSSAYVYNKDSASDISYIRVMGSYGENAPYYNCTYKESKSCAIGQETYLPNTVREEGYTYAGLLFDPGNGYHISVYLLWSPDSV